MNCLSCGNESAPTANFCAACGHRLRDSSAAAAAAPSERRQLTVMFCDLAESTRLSLELDAEDFTSAISAYRDVCARVVRRWRGYVSRYVGDGVLVYFGYPRAAEDDALRGVAAAWDFLKGVSSLRLPQTSGERAGRHQLQARVGLHTGLAVVGDFIGVDSVESAGVSGAVPNIAAHLQSLARPGEVVISDATAALLPAAVRLRPIDVEAHRDRIGSVMAYAVADVPRDLTRRRPVSNTTLIGRQAIIDRLVAALDDRRSPTPGVLVIGEPGVGKSRLVRELLTRAPANALPWVEVACVPYGQTSPLLPFREWIDITDHGETLGLAARDSGGIPGAATASIADDAASPFRRRQRAFDQLRVALDRLGPRVGIVVEDLHWADSTTTEFVAELLSAASSGKFVLLMTSRQRPAGALACVHGLRLEVVDRLPPGESASLIRELTASKPLASLEIAEIIEHADGVPLYIEEFVRALSKTDSGPDRIPLTLRDSLMATLDTLGAGRTVALCASVFGRRFRYRHLRELLGRPDDELQPMIGALVEARILVQSGSLPDGWLEFRHALLRDTAYHTLLKSERERWHRRAAQLADEGRLPIEGSMPELLAIHNSLGGDHKKAIDYWIRAHGRAVGESANVEALAHVRHGLDDCRVLRASDPCEADRLELELLRRLVNPLVAISGWSTPELEQVYARAVALCAKVGNEDAAFEVERGRFNVHLLRGELRSADAIADRLVATARASGDIGQRENRMLTALRAKALPDFYRASFRAARRRLNRVLALYDVRRHAGHAVSSGIEPAALAMSYLAWIDASEGDLANSRERAEAAIARAKAAGHAFSSCYALCFAASCSQIAGVPSLAARHSDEALRVGNQHNFQYWIAWARAVKGWVRGLDAPGEGVDLIDEAMLAYAATGSTLIAPYFEALACNLYRLSGAGPATAREAELWSRAEKGGIWFWKAALEVRPSPTR